MDLNLIHNINECLSNDDLDQALKLMHDLCSLNQKKETIEYRIKIQNLQGRFKRNEHDRLMGIISSTIYYENLNQVRYSILKLIKTFEIQISGGNGLDEKAIASLQESIDNTNKELSLSKKLDFVFKVILLFVLISCLLILFTLIIWGSDSEMKIYLGGVAIYGLTASLYFYLKIRAIELGRN